MLITFEGIDGSGKSTQARLLVERLAEEGSNALLIREPGGTDLSERVRDILLDTSLRIDPLTELLLFSAARAQVVSERIQPALQAGHIVISDRFYDSTLAYQGGGRELDDGNWLQKFSERVTRGIVPDRTYLIEIEPKEALARREQRFVEAAAGEEEDRMEIAGLPFYKRVAATYRALSDAAPDRFLRLNGALSREELHTRIWADLKTLRQQ